MSKPGYALLQDVIMDADFPDLDLALRRGRHVDREDTAWYALLSDAQEQLEPFYRRYGCELIHKTDGYFYLLPTGDKISRKQLSPSDMLVGQALALLYLDPANIERGGMIAHEDLVAQLSSVLGTDALIAAFNPGTGAGKRKKYDERIAQRNVRNRVAESVRRLAAMGFVDTGPAEGTEGERVKLRPALMRFAEPVRGLSEPAEALAKLVARGEVALTPEELEEAAAESGEDAEPVSGVAPRSGVEDVADGGELEAAAGSESAGVRAVQAEAAELGADSESTGSSADDAADAATFGLTADAEAPEASGDELAADVESSAEGAADARAALLDVETAGAGIDDVELEPAYAADIDAAEELGIAESGPGADAESFGSEPDALAGVPDAEATPAAADAADSGKPVHPMDRDLDWADILPDPQENG